MPLNLLDIQPISEIDDFQIYSILFTQPLRSGRIWHKVNF